jgi:hypothetical protein
LIQPREHTVEVHIEAIIKTEANEKAQRGRQR